MIFPGGLLPPHAIAGHWGRRYRAAVAGSAHLRGLFAADRPDPPLRYLRHYLRPSAWVARPGASSGNGPFDRFCYS